MASTTTKQTTITWVVFRAGTVPPARVVERLVVEAKVLVEVAELGEVHLPAVLEGVAARLHLSAPGTRAHGAATGSLRDGVNT